LEPYSVVRAAGLDRPASVFDDADAWRAGVLTLPLVADVRVRRTLPGTVTLEVREDEPVALVAAGTLRPVDGAGRLLELDPAGAMLDLPVLSGVTLAGATVAGGESAAAVATVARLLRRAPAVAERLSQAHLSGGRLRLSFRDSRAEALLPPAATDVQVTQLRLAVADLAARGELESVQTIDVRFHDQVVVSFGRRTVS
ncbi:MAG: cell division protein FtsQ/DivIB, partial [Gemmatimonadota bacterium]